MDSVKDYATYRIPKVKTKLQNMPNPSKTSDEMLSFVADQLVSLIVAESAKIDFLMADSTGPHNLKVYDSSIRRSAYRKALSIVLFALDSSKNN